MALAIRGGRDPAAVTSVHECECCGCGGRLFAVKVRACKNAAVTTTLHLCSRCLEGEDRTWRLAWERDR
jgi:predicted metal-binding protein